MHARNGNDTETDVNKSIDSDSGVCYTFPKASVVHLAAANNDRRSASNFGMMNGPLFASSL